jgi:putative transposase
MRREQAEAVVALVNELADEVGLSGACRALAVPRSWYYRRRREPPTAAGPSASRPTPDHALSPSEKERVQALLASERFGGQSPRQVFATLLDEGHYLCSWRTMYRLLATNDGHDHPPGRRRAAAAPRPELVAHGPNQVWSWDITYLSGPRRGCFYYLYVVLDIYSRYVVGWMVAEAESSQWATQLIAETCAKQRVPPQQLTLHADRGGVMKSFSLAELLARLQVTRSHSRPHTADDNPYSESHFKTLKHHPAFPRRFADIHQARAWARAFFDWYNHQHHHIALGLMTPAVVHAGQAEMVRRRRQQVLDQAYARQPRRFPAGPPVAAAPAAEVWINQPPPTVEAVPTPLAAPAE